MMRELYVECHAVMSKYIVNLREAAIRSLQSGSVEPARDLAQQLAGVEASLKLLEETQAKLERS